MNRGILGLFLCAAIGCGGASGVGKTAGGAGIDQLPSSSAKTSASPKPAPTGDLALLQGKWQRGVPDGVSLVDQKQTVVIEGDTLTGDGFPKCKVMVNPDADPKRMDLVYTSDKEVKDIKTVEGIKYEYLPGKEHKILAIYKVEGDLLYLHWLPGGFGRPSHFAEWPQDWPVPPVTKPFVRAK